MTNYTFEYFPHRGITAATFRQYDVKTKIGPDGEPLAVGFRYPNGSSKIRDAKRKDFKTELSPDGANISKAGLFGRDRFAAGTHKWVAITEGEYDALALWQVCRLPVVSVQSSSSAVRDVTIDHEWLNSFERIYLAFDSDAKGREALGRVAKLFDPLKTYVVKFNRKDANEYLQHGAEQELANIFANSKKYLPDTVKSTFVDFKSILDSSPKWGVAYPFKTLNDMTYGIRTGETVLITAQEGIGKTELMHAIEHQLLKETDDAIAAIFLEEPERRHLQALAGLELAKPVHLPDSGVTGAEVFSALEKLVRVDERLHVYTHYGSDDPEVLLDTVRFLAVGRLCKYVLLDHITMVVSGLAGENDERRALDYLSTRLEMMVKELDIALIIVSHVNDDGKTRGSRNISKVADIRIDISRNLQADDPVERNTTYLKVAKNRYGGKTGPAGKLLFDLNTFTFTEILEAANDNLPYEESRRVA